MKEIRIFSVIFCNIWTRFSTVISTIYMWRELISKLMPTCVNKSQELVEETLNTTTLHVLTRVKYLLKDTCYVLVTGPHKNYIEAEAEINLY